MRFFQRHPTVPVLRFTGAIGMATPLRPGISLATTAAGIERAFNLSKTPAVAVIINSPGGSPVQSHLIYLRIRALAKETSKTVYVFTEDVCASGGYFLAVAGDEIYADPSSIVGSIGVISASFGFDKLIDKIGVERRVYTSGERKMALDPFAPEKADEVGRLKALQADVHQTFIGIVKERRGAKLKAADDALFSGEFWSGPKARDLGLVDGIGDVRTKMRERFGDKVRLPVVAFGGGWLRRRLGQTLGQSNCDPAQLAGGIGAGLAADLVSTLEARALWARFGL
jgi:signal peptide peptidase SppA